MPAYVIAEVNVTDPQLYDEYKKLVPATVEKYGGRFAVRGGTVESKEGGWKPARMVVLEFPSMEKARAWYHSPEYAPVLAMRLKAGSAKLILVEGA
ncbi:MAG TPA: DUF1330 domain-containing protein [Burkholderiales bacterium]|jgi:uncharacterized protein (DUF1330 family)